MLPNTNQSLNDNLVPWVGHDLERNKYTIHQTRIYRENSWKYGI